jgi:hypothetical protein
MLETKRVEQSELLFDKYFHIELNVLLLPFTSA